MIHIKVPFQFWVKYCMSCRRTQLQQDATFHQQHVDSFVQLTGDSNPIHTAAAGHPVVPGILAASLFPGIIGTRFPGALYTKQDLTFRRPIEV